MNTPDEQPDLAGDGDEETLIRAAVAGDRLALERLLAIYGTRLAAYIGPRLPKALGEFVGADDILQEVFLRAFRSINECQATSATSFFAWLKTIANNQIINAVKAQQRKKRGGDRQQLRQMKDQSGSIVLLVEQLMGTGKTPSQSISIREATRAIQIGVAELPDDQRRAIQLHFLEGKTIPETAEAMGRTSGAVRGLIHRAKKTLLTVLGRSSHWLSTG